jgi:hypothetical protein
VLYIQLITVSLRRASLPTDRSSRCFTLSWSLKVCAVTLFQLITFCIYYDSLPADHCQPANRASLPAGRFQSALLLSSSWYHCLPVFLPADITVCLSFFQLISLSASDVFFSYRAYFQLITPIAIAAEVLFKGVLLEGVLLGLYSHLYHILNTSWLIIVALPEWNTFPLLLACSTYWLKVWAIVNPRLDSCKHINTLCGDSTISTPYWPVFYRIKWALQDVSELGYLFLTSPVCI